MNADQQKKLNIELRSRQGQLETIAKGNRGTLTLGKGIGLGGGLGVVWMLTIANPAIGAIVGAIALVNYAAAAMKETEKTGEFRPLLGRKSLSSLAQGLNREGATPPPTASIEDDALYLDDRDLGEWLLLRTAMPQTVQFLSQCPEENRDEALDLAATEAYRSYGYLFRAEPNTRHQMKREQVGQYAFAAVRQESGHLLEPSTAPAAFDNDQNIGMNTRLGAIAVPATTVAPEPIAPKVQPSNAFAKVLSDPFESRAIFGSQRTGKSLFAAVCSATIAAKQQTQIFHLNLASFGDEDLRYWKHAALSIAADLSAADEFAAKELIKNASRLISQFYATQNAVLIVDEIATIGSTSNRYKALLEPLMCLIADKITTLASSGKKRRQAIWTIAPEFVAGGLSQDTKAVKKLSLCYLSIAPGRTVDWEGQDIGCKVELYRQLDANFSVATLPKEGSFNCDRIAMIDGVWMPVGDLPSLGTPINEARARLENLIQQDAVEAAPTVETAQPVETERPDLPENKIMAIAMELEEWISQHPQVNPKDYYSKFNAARKGFSRPQFRYLLALTEG